MDNIFKICLGLVALIPLLPLVGAFLNGLYSYSGYRQIRPIIHWIACGTVFISFLLSLGIFLHLIQMPEAGRSITVNLWSWIHIGDVNADVAFLIDPLSVSLMLVVTGVGFLIHVYSVGYMAHDPSYARYFSYLNLFTFAMLVLVMSDNILLMFVGWEGVGLCSYLLIGFWHQDIDKARAGMKAFVVNRIGDFGFLVGVLLLFCTLYGLGYPTLRFTEFRQYAPLLEGVQWAGVSAVGLATLLFFVGATGKSAQIPLYVWLPDAMAGPTPVSALIHAATMVTAGVYMIGRMSSLFVLSPETMTVVATVGFLTAIFAATIGIAQNDIKRVLAYSTVSQLGYMIGAMGVAAFVAGIFHLITHAFFKALLFLGSGAVIHAMSDHQDMRVMGGLKHKMPVTYRTFLVGTLAIAGIFPFAGFFSKDEILWHAFSQKPILWVLGLAGAFITAFYMFRLVGMTFLGKNRADPHVQEHIHEAPKSMTIPLIILAVLSLAGGFLGVPAALGHLVGWEHSHLLHDWLAPTMAIPEVAHHGIPPAEYILMGLSLCIAIAGCAIGYILYTRRQDIPQNMARRYARLHQMIYNKYYVDEIYNAVVIRGVIGLMNFLAAFDNRVIDGFVNLSAFMTKIVSWISGWFDNFFVDGVVNAVAETTQAGGKNLRLIQTGKIQNYIYVLVAGVIIFMIWRLIG